MSLVKKVMEKVRLPFLNLLLKCRLSGKGVKEVQLRMKRLFKDDERLDLPVTPLGYKILSYNPELTEQWIDLLNTIGDFGFWTKERLEKEILSGLIENGGIFAEFEGRLIACGAACSLQEFKPYAVLMYVAVEATHRKKGLGEIVSSLAVRASRNAGYSGIVLNTDDYRSAAVKMYLKLGFRPDIETFPRTEKRWQSVLKRFN